MGMAMVMPEDVEVELIELTLPFMLYRIRLDDMGRKKCVSSMQVWL